MPYNDYTNNKYSNFLFYCCYLFKNSSQKGLTTIFKKVIIIKNEKYVLYFSIKSLVFFNKKLLIRSYTTHIAIFSPRERSSYSNARNKRRRGS